MNFMRSIGVLGEIIRIGARLCSFMEFNLVLKYV
jgi:hypothetical protein